MKRGHLSTTQSAEWHTSASPKPEKLSKSKVKTMLIVFFDAKGVVHKDKDSRLHSKDAVLKAFRLSRRP
jgi:hypothetical protein